MHALWVALVLARATVEPATGGEEPELGWHAPEGCPDQSAVQDQVHRLLARAQVDPAGPQIRADATVESTPDGFRLHMQLRQGDTVGTRQIEAPDCAQLAEAAALIIAIAADPQFLDRDVPRTDPDAAPASADDSFVPPPPPAAAPSEPPRPSTPPESPADASPPTADPFVTRTAEPNPRRNLTFSVSAGGGMDTGSWRAVGPSVSVGVALLGPHWRTDLVGAYQTPQELTAREDPTITARIQAWTVGARGCGVPTMGPRQAIELPLCGGVEAGAFHGTASGPNLEGRRNRAPWISVVAGAGIIGRLGPRVSLWLRPDLLVTPVPPRFVTDQGTVILATRPVGGRILAGLEIRGP